MVMLFTFVGIPYFKVKKIKISYSDPDNPMVKELRHKRPDIDMKFALYGGLGNVKADIDELYSHRKFYDYIINLLRIQAEAKMCINLTLDSFRNLSGLMKKSKRWWLLQYYKAGKNRKATLEKLLDGHYDNFNNFKILVDELKRIRVDYENNLTPEEKAEEAVS